MNRQTENSTGCYRNIRYELTNRELNRLPLELRYEPTNRELNRLLQEHQVGIDKQGTKQAAPVTSGMK
jgi:hypothetical protein